MRKCYPHAGIALAVAAVLVGVPTMHAYAVPEADGSSVEASAEEESSNTLWKAEISEYDSSLSLVQYEEVNPTQEQVSAIEAATASAPAAADVTSASSDTVTGTLAASEASGGSGSIGGAAALGSPESGQFAFTTYGYGHCVGMSQNGANYYATYGGYDYQSILFHYYPGTTLVQEDTSQTITANGVTGSMLDIISQIVYNEMSSTMHTEAMKAQAVAAYSYIMFYGGNVTGVGLKANPPQNVVDAVSSVLGQALYYDGSYALTVYGASSGGATANATDIFGTNYPYLVSVSSDYDAEYDPHYGEVTYLSVDEVRSRIQSAYGISLSGNPYNWLQLELGDNGYVRSVTIDGQKTVSGYSLRGVLGLKSARFAYICG